MCGRFTRYLPWQEIVRLYRLTLDYEISKNTAPAYNIAPTVEVPFVPAGDNGSQRLREGRWWLVPWWAKEMPKAGDVQRPHRDRGHVGHKALIAEGLRRVGPACIIAVRDTLETDAKNPFGFAHVKSRIESSLREFKGRFVVVLLPNITSVFYGRDVGYNVERIDIDPSLQTISATSLRKLMLC